MPASLAEKGQYALAFVVVAAMLLVAGFPTFVIFFFGIFAYFLWKIFTAGTRSETREIFEFYLTANEILRDDDRRWYGFEVRETIARGERIARFMTSPPPLVHFALGALYRKTGEFEEAAANLSKVVEAADTDELKMVFPSQELRNYVRILRKIEREPAEAPLTSAAVRSLERARRLRGQSLLEECRRLVAAGTAGPARDGTPLELANADLDSIDLRLRDDESDERAGPPPPPSVTVTRAGRRGRGEKSGSEPFIDRKPITEVLHDIYDKNVQ